jgi:hypothetical protein
MIRLFVLVVCGGASVALAQGQFKADLNGYQEVPTLSTASSGQVSVKIADDQKSLSVTLSFSKLEGVAQSGHLGFGVAGMTSTILAYICGGTKPSCPTTADGSVTATIAPADILAIGGQGIAAGDLAGVIHAIESGAVYVNVRTTKYANGEIRGQLGRGNGPPPGKGKGRGNGDD